MVEHSRNLAWSTFGRYALLERIGAGGMAEIYRAKTFGAAGFEKEFAIKMILPNLVDDKEFVAMFINEAKIAVSLYHANIVQVFDLGELDSQYYIAMEFVHGKDLLDVLARCAQHEMKIPLNLVMFITMEFLKGLDFAHRAKDAYGEDLNIIHRDVSPSNVLISYSGDVKIGDFGVAKAAIQRTLTESGTLKGKVGYMSPEQVVGDEIDHRSDVFSAGIVFFEALSMSRLFVGNSDLDVMLRVRDADIEASLKKAGPMPQALEEIVRKALTKHREERFQTAGEFYQALQDFCYSHRIKVSGNDLSNFMRRLFADEIEKEKKRRKSEEESGRKQVARAQVAQVAEQDRFTPPPNHSTPKKQSRKPDTDDLADLAAAVAEPARAPETQAPAQPKYRYRDDGGLIFGPMSESELLKLVKERPPTVKDRISIDGGEWIAPAEMEILAPHVRSPVNKAARSVPVGAGVYKPRTAQAKQLGDEDTQRDNSNNSIVQLLNSSPETSDISEIGAGSSPMLDVPDAPDLQTSEEAKRVISEMRKQYASYEGEFDSTSFARIFARLHRNKATGRLHVTHNDVEKSIYFESGEPVLVDSNQETELLGFFLLSRRIITQAQLEEGLARLSEWGGRLGDALVAIGAIPAHEIFRHLSDQMREKILDIFTWPEGYWGYYENQQPDTHGYPLGIDAYSTVADGCLECMPVTLLRELYHRRMNTALHVRDASPVDLDKLRLPTKAMRVINMFESGQHLQGLCSKLPENQHELVLRVVYLLHQVEHLTFEDTESQELPK